MLNIDFVKPNILDFYNKIEIIQQHNNYKKIKAQIYPDNELKDQLLKKIDNKLIFTENNPDLIIITETETGNLTKLLHRLIPLRNGYVIAPITNRFFKNRPLFPISIPKAGTHLLLKLLKLFGYMNGGEYQESVNGGYLYFADGIDYHISAKNFYKNTLNNNLFDHDFVYSPSVFIFRNPLDIIISESRYFNKIGKNPYYNYFPLDEKGTIDKLIGDKYLIGTIRDRVAEFLAWINFRNVIPLPFEDLIGEKGGGNQEKQIKLIWSLQLKLQIPGSPNCYIENIYDVNSPTFSIGKIGQHKNILDNKQLKTIKNLNQDFMEILGYNYSSIFSSKSEYFINKPLIYDETPDFPPTIKQTNYLGYNIVKYKNIFYGAHLSLGPTDLSVKKNREKLLFAPTPGELKEKIINKHIQNHKK